MNNIKHYIFKKLDNDIVAIEYCKNNFIYECSYEELKDILLLYVTPKDLYDKQKEEELLDKFSNATLEELSNETEKFFNNKDPKNFINNMLLEKNILTIESYDIDSLELETSIIIIDEELLKDEKVRNVIALIKETYQNNEDSLKKQFCDLTKENENIRIVKNGISTYLEKKKFNLTKEEAIITDIVINRNLEECFNYIDRAYRQNHPLSFMMRTIVPVVVDLVMLGSVLIPLHSLMAVLAFLASLGAVTTVACQKWRKLIFKKYIDLKKDLEETYNLSYNKDDRKVSLYDPYQFYDAFTKCIKNTLELAYCEASTDLDEEIAILYALLNEYQKNGKNKKKYFVTILISIRKQIILKRSSTDTTLNRRVKQNDDEFIKGCINYLTGRNTTMLDNKKVKSVLEIIKQNEENYHLEINLDLMLELVEYVCKQFSESSYPTNDGVINQSDGVINQSFQNKEDYPIEYDINMSLEKSFKRE